MIRPLLALPLALLAAPAVAENALQAFFPKPTTCYNRQYSADHLAKHPVQQVRHMVILPERGEMRPGELVLRVAVTLRSGGEIYQGDAYCTAAGADLACQMEGDAGAFTLDAAKDGALRLTVGAPGMSFEGAQDFITLEGTSGDDRVFLLPKSDCL